MKDEVKELGAAWESGCSLGTQGVCNMHGNEQRGDFQKFY